MAFPWDPPPLTQRGDADPEKTYAGVGRVTSIWEMIEFELARIHSVFVGKPDNDMALREYGPPAVFRSGRLPFLIKSACAFFKVTPNQTLEGQFDRLVQLLNGFSERRNDVAHGTVFLIHTLDYFRVHLDQLTRDLPQYAVIPPYHTLDRHLARPTPAHAYASAELLQLASKMLELAEATRMFRNSLVPPELRDKPQSAPP